MTLESSMHSWGFDFDLWSAAVSHAMTQWSAEFLAESVGVHASTIKNWGAGVATHKNKWPNMQNFISMCDVLDLDPRQFFCIERVGR